jgi:hypothetical protein
VCGLSISKKGYHCRTNLVKDEKGGDVTDINIGGGTNSVSSWKKYMGLSDLWKTEIQTAEPLFGLSPVPLRLRCWVEKLNITTGH